MNKHSVSSKLKYAFDNTMSKGTPAMIIWLGLFSISIIIFATLVLVLFKIYPEGEEPLNFIEAFWQSMMRTLDPGTMGGDTGWGFRIVQFFVTLGGIFIISTLIGVLSSGIEAILTKLRKGRSFVIENNHTLILGWSPKVFTIISELVIANENQKKPRIVILAQKDKVEMEDEIKDNITDLKNTKVICRNGNPYDLFDIGIVNPQTSKSIIILTSDDEDADTQTIKTILAITNNPDRRKENYHIVAELKDEKNLDVIKMIGNDEVELVMTDDIVARIMTQTSRQSGLSIVYTELMDFGGDEIYFNEEKLLVGKTYGDSLLAYKSSAVIGIRKNTGEVLINPDMKTVVEKGDEVIAITEDDDTLIVDNGNNIRINREAINGNEVIKDDPDMTLVFGWNERAYTIIREMDSYSTPGSVLKVVSTYEIPENDRKKVDKEIKNLKIEYLKENTTDRKVIESLGVTNYEHVLVLSYKDELDLQKADASTLVTLLHLRKISEETGKDINIVSEMLEIHNPELAEVTKADDFIVSDKLISLLMTQVSENKHLMRVFEILFDSEGSEIYLKPVRNYIKCGMDVNFYTVIESAKEKGETAIGYRICSDIYDSSKSYGIVVNPGKEKLINFSDGDKLIVLAEN